MISKEGEIGLKRNTGIFGLIVILLVLIVSIFELKGDYLKYITTSTNSAPFYIFAIKKLIIPIVVAVVLFVRIILTKRDKKT